MKNKYANIIMGKCTSSVFGRDRNKQTVEFIEGQKYIILGKIFSSGFSSGFGYVALHNYDPTVLVSINASYFDIYKDGVVPILNKHDECLFKGVYKGEKIEVGMGFSIDTDSEVIILAKIESKELPSGYGYVITKRNRVKKEDELIFGKYSYYCVTIDESTIEVNEKELEENYIPKIAVPYEIK